MSTRAGSASDEERPRKRLRKGTHSCWGCKRRKVKCIFKDENDTVCTECAIRHTPCVSQEHGEDEASPANRGRAVRDRVGRLEDLMEMLVKKIDSIDRKTSESDSRKPSILVDASEIALPDILTPVAATNSSSAAAPLMAIFDRPRLSCRTGEITPIPEPEKNPWTSRVDVAPAGRNRSKLDAVRKVLIEQLPSKQDLDILFAEVPEWWTAWELYITNENCTKDREWLSPYIERIRNGNFHPAEVATALLVVAICIQAMPLDFNYERLHLPTSPDRLLNKYMNMVSSFVTTDDEMVGSIQGLECLLMQGKFLVNMGRPRSAWMMYRRGLNLCMLMGLNRKSRRLHDKAYYKAREVWWEFFQLDRFLSLILGLPHGVSESACDMTDEPELVAERSVTLQYRMRLCSLTGKMVERNVGSEADSYAVTQDLDVALDSLAAELSEEWWSTKRLPGESKPTFIERITIQFVHMMNKAMLHVPFMMQAGEQKRYMYSKDTCLECCRGMLVRYLILWRDCVEATSMCRIGDFLGFSACVVLLLSNICWQKAVPITPTEIDQIEKDWQLINDTISEMGLSSRRFGGAVAEQSVKILKTLRLVGTNPAAVSEKDLVLSIPYFGTVRVSKDMGHPISMGMQAPIHPYFPPSFDDLPAASPSSSRNPLPSPPASDMTPPTVQSFRQTSANPVTTSQPMTGATNPTMTFVPDSWVFPAFDSTITDAKPNPDPSPWTSIDFNLDLGGVNAYSWNPNPDTSWNESFNAMETMLDQPAPSLQSPPVQANHIQPKSVADAIEAQRKYQAQHAAKSQSAGPGPATGGADTDSSNKQGPAQKWSPWAVRM